MSVIIENMELPVNCDKCKLYRDEGGCALGCNYTVAEWRSLSLDERHEAWGKRHKNCPLREV